MNNLILNIQSDSSTFHSAKWLQTEQAAVILAEQSDSLVFKARKSDGTIVVVGGTGSTASTGGLQELGKIQALTSTTVEPEQCAVYTYTLVGGQTFSFVHSSDSRVTNFRLWLTMPSTVVSFTFPSDVRWVDQTAPTFVSGNALYCLVFEWCPTISKWRGNLQESQILL